MYQLIFLNITELPLQAEYTALEKDRSLEIFI